MQPGDQEHSPSEATFTLDPRFRSSCLGQDSNLGLGLSCACELLKTPGKHQRVVGGHLGEKREAEEGFQAKSGEEEISPPVSLGTRSTPPRRCPAHRPERWAFVPPAAVMAEGGLAGGVGVGVWGWGSVTCQVSLPSSSWENNSSSWGSVRSPGSEL